jgi:ribose/xylose/arabinose/galactoside ABC-type transport system permease subunit
MVFIIAGFLAGLAGVLTTARSTTASMRTLMGLELDTIAAVCIGGISLMGGRGTLIGAIIGVMIIGVVNNGMSILGAGPFMQGIVRGAIIIAAVAVDYIRKR